jgi:hypothetical protein
MDFYFYTKHMDTYGLLGKIYGVFPTHVCKDIRPLAKIRLNNYDLEYHYRVLLNASFLVNNCVICNTVGA